MKYKVGDKVRIKSLDWYNENKDEYGNIDVSHDFTFYADRSKYCGRVFTIDVVFDNCYTVKEDNHEYYWADEMFEGLVQDENNSLTETVVDYVKESNDRYRIVIDPRFDIEVDEGEYYAVRRKKEYPKSYEECCKVMGVNHTNDLDICEHCDYKTEITYYEDSLLEKIEALYCLCICRDAYWKIAGDEMGLGKPWEPDWREKRYIIYRNQDDIIRGYRAAGFVEHHIFEFPTEEMRDAFYDNFKEVIKSCKELL